MWRWYKEDRQWHTHQEHSLQQRLVTQIEKKLLTIVFACQRFQAYIYGGEGVNVETDHKLLEVIVRKPLNTALKQLQCMMLVLQKYDLNVYYKRGETMVLVDILSRSYLSEVNSCEVAQECKSVDHRSSLPVTNDGSNCSLHLHMAQCCSSCGMSCSVDDQTAGQECLNVCGHSSIHKKN